MEDLRLGEVFLSQDESLHIVKSFRARAGDCFDLCDGKGRFASAELAEPDARACRAVIKSISEPEPRPLLHLAIGCLSDGGEEDVAFHAAQMPLAAIHLLRTERSQEPKASGLDRLRRRMEAKCMAALKQSRQPWLTEVVAPAGLLEFLDGFDGNLVVCDIDGSPAPPSLPLAAAASAVLAGPEGGFSPSELELLRARGAVFMSLGKTRLRAATAPIFAVGRMG